MTTLGFADFTDEFGERRRRAESMTPNVLRALDLVARDAGGAEPGSRATVYAASDLLSDTVADLGRAEEELRAQNEALFTARMELEQDQQVFRDLFDYAPTASLVTSGGGHILRINAAALGLLARPVNAVVGKPLAAYVALADRPAFRAAFCRSLRSAGVETWPVRLTPKHGEPIECRVRTRVIRSPFATPTQPVDGAPAASLHWMITEEVSTFSDDLV